MAREIKTIRERLDAISAGKDSFRLEVRQEVRQKRKERETGVFVVEEKVVGRERDKTEILKRLMSLEAAETGTSSRRERVSVVPIVGMGGLGKTTLAQVVYNDREVEKHFNVRLWVSVSDNVDNDPLIEKVVRSIKNKSTKSLSMARLEEIVDEKIRGKRFLLVLDDVWKRGISKEWEKLKDLLGKTCVEGSRIIITTRDDMVARFMDGFQPHHLGRLDMVDSWTLFRKKAFGGEPTNPTIEKTAKEILAKCGGVPLAISMIGRILYFEVPEREWPFFLKTKLSNITQHENKILPILKLSYDHLPPHLKPCFAYCRLFPKDHEFDCQTLITLWIAQGFIKPCQTQSLEEIGYKYFTDLLWRSFFQEAKKDKFNMVRTCKMHDLIHDLAIQVAGEKYAMLASNEEKTLGKSVRHLSLDLSFDSPSIDSLSRAQKEETLRLRSFLLLPTFEKRDHLAWDEIISNLKFLRMLDLHDVGIEEVPSSISKLKHLRYLDLSGNKMGTLPPSITKLVNLQTLKLNDCEELHELPSEIEKLVNLRHLELVGCDNIAHMPRGLGQLTNLQTLSLVVLGKNIPSLRCFKLDELMGLNNLRGKLEIKGIRCGMVTTAGETIKRKEHLQSLHLHFKRSIDDASSREQEWKTTLEGLQPHPNIRELTLSCYGGSSLSDLLLKLTNLVKLELHDLPSLEYITNNEGDSSFSTSSSPTAPVLPSVQELVLSRLPNLRGWWRSDMAENQSGQVIFPRLSSLAIRDCPRLTSLPCYQYVEEMELHNTSWKSFEQTVLKRVPPQAQISGTTAAAATKQASTSSAASSSATCSNIVSSYPLSKLTSLSLEDIMDLQYLPDDGLKCLASLKQLRISKCHQLKYLPLGIQHLTSLEELTIARCDEFEAIEWPETPALTSLRTLKLWSLPKLKHLLSPAIQYLTSLQRLTIYECEELQLSNDNSIAWQALTSLRSLKLKGPPQIETLPRGFQFLTALEYLTIAFCHNFTALPDWICKLSSLQSLYILECPNFKSVPGSISSLTSLQVLWINDKKMNPRDIREDLDMSSIREDSDTSST